MPRKSRDLLPILAAEYQALKAEQTARISLRENAINANIVTIGALLAVAATLDGNRLYVILLIPFAAASTYWVYLNNDLAVSKLQRYFQDEFPKQVMASIAAKSSDKKDLCAIISCWETYHRKDRRSRALRKIGNTVFVLLGSVGMSMGALVATWESVRDSGAVSVRLMWAGGCLATTLVLIALIRTSDLNWKVPGRQFRKAH